MNFFLEEEFFLEGPAGYVPLIMIYICMQRLLVK